MTDENKRMTTDTRPDNASASHPHATQSQHNNSMTSDNAIAPSSEGEEAIPLKAVNEIGRATARDVREALHQVIDPELGVDVVDLGLVYGVEIDDNGRAIITMTLTTPACPLTGLIEDQCAQMLAGIVEEFRIEWTWKPRWSYTMITPEGKEQLAAIGLDVDNLPVAQ